MTTRPKAPEPWNENDLERLQDLLDAIPAPLQPLDVTMLDGYLCGVLLQPERVPAVRWLPPIVDSEQSGLPAGVPSAELGALIERRHAELDLAIEHRQWFDPWIYELDDDATPSEAVMPWVAGFATACAHFPALTELSKPDLLEPLATLYMHLDPDDLEDADELLAEIGTLEPPRDMAEAVEGLVRSTLLLADVSRPLRKPQGPRPGGQPGGRSGGGQTGSHRRSGNPRGR
jgi:uncharacterized protein